MKATRLFLTPFVALFTLILLSLIGSPATAQAQTATTTTLQQSAACPTSGCVTTLTATVIAGSAAVHPGRVVFCDGTPVNCENGAPIGTAQLIANGTATIKLALAPGSHSLRAYFHGTKTYSGSSSAIVTAAVTPTATQKVTSLNPALGNAYGDGFRFSAIALFTGPIPLTGTVSFIDTSRNNALLASVPAVTAPPPNNPYFTYTSLNVNPLDLSKVPANLQTNSVATVTGDFNNDGFQDIAQLDSGTEITVLLGDGKGGFTPLPTQVFGAGFQGNLFTGDFNSDGRLDIAGTGAEGLFVALGNGDGTFTAAPPSAPVSGAVAGSFVGDFNRDGIPDVATPCRLPLRGGGCIAVSIGVGDGTFTAGTQLMNDEDLFSDIAVGDFNGDGIQDLIVLDSDLGYLLIYYGKPDGTFPEFPSNIGPAGLYFTIGDFDGDGITDIITSGYTALTFWHGKGDGTFTSLYSDGSSFSQIFAGDFRGDGKLGFATLAGGIYFQPSRITAQGIDTYGGPAEIATSTPADYLLSIADFNGDGLPDILSYHPATGAAPMSFEGMINQFATATSNTTVYLDSGTHDIVASYSGDATHDASVSEGGLYYSPGIAYPNGFTGESGLTLSGSASLLGSTIELTDGGQFERGSFFSSARINLTTYLQTDFDFQIKDPVADGFAFVVQANGPDAIGSNGGGLGYGNPPGAAGPSITNSVAVAFDLHSNQGEGGNSVRLETNGVTSPAGAIDLTSSGIDLHSGHSFHAVIKSYNTGTLTLAITDLVTNKTFSTTFSFTSPNGYLLGGTMAYAGFTGATGSGTSIQTISNWNMSLNSSVFVPPAYPTPTYSDGFTGTTALSFNGGSLVSGSALQLTNGTSYERTSTYFTKKLGPGYGFSTDFDFDLGTGAGDGFTFVIQNGHISALGSAGGGLGYGPDQPGGPGYSIPNSTAIKFDLHDNAGEGINSTGIYINGASPTTPAIDLTPSGINLHNGHKFHAQISYNPAISQNITLTITDLTVYSVFQTTFAANTHNLPSLNEAFVGFTAGTGNTPSSIRILNWTFTNY